jgi:hypothetical protein
LCAREHGHFREDIASCTRRQAIAVRCTHSATRCIFLRSQTIVGSLDA